jgi:vacuolar-type H+-ATPase catalytic subunit A/Vma1
VKSSEGRGEVVAPGPGVVDADVQAALAVGDPGGDVQEPVAQGRWFGGGERAVEQGGAGPGE